MKSCTFLTILILAISQISCSPPPDDTAPQTVVDNFFRTYEADGNRKAVTILFSMNRWITKEDANTVADQMDEIIAQIGAYYGKEKVAENSYGPNLVQYIYVVRYERQPLKFIFKFYKPNDKWQMQSFNYESNFLGELDEAGKAHRFKENARN